MKKFYDTGEILLLLLTSRDTHSVAHTDLTYPCTGPEI